MEQTDATTSNTLGTAAQATLSAQPQTYTAEFRGDGLDFFLLALKNAFLRSFTLSIYQAWAQTNIRRFMAENSYFAGVQFLYTGTGGELFGAYIRAFFIFFGIGLLSALFTFGLELPLMGQLVVTAATIMAITPFALYG